MPAEIYYDDDASLESLGGKRIAILGYGSQGRSHALNLKDSGLDVIVGLRAESASRELAEKEGLTVASVEDACAGANLVAFMLPDQHQARVYRESIRSVLDSGVCLLFAHGFNIHYGTIDPPVASDVVMVGPKAPGPMLREAYETGLGVPAVVAVHQDATGEGRERALAYAKGLGCLQAGVIETSFAEETETDLFGEQAILAGGVSALIKAGFDVLVQAGYQEETAYFECLHEMKLVVDLIQRLGINGMRDAISDTAKYGSLTRGKRVIGPEAQKIMTEILEDIRSGAFAEEWAAESRAGAPVLEAERRTDAEHPIEEVGRRLRAMMPNPAG
ncbi:ketol-acid reductoisomerase [soil metagenome]